MTHKIISIKPMEKFTLLVGFQNGVEKTYDMRTLYPVFPQFKVFENDVNLFNQVQIDTGGYGISWNDNLDLSAEDIWEDGVEVNNKEVDIVAALAENLIKARDIVGMTQKQLSEHTGIYQADISKIERGLANPSLSTLKRLADGMGLKLQIEFVDN
ncbi:MAG: helix-turn-helix domain-containing protein [Eubacterium sp.]